LRVASGILCLALAASTAQADVLYGIGSGVGDGSSNLYRIDNYATSPTAVDLGETGHVLGDIAIDPTTNRFYGISNTQLFELNPNNAHATLIGTTGVGSQNALGFDASGQLYSWGFQDTNLYRVDKNSGLATVVGDTTYLSAGDLVFDANGQLYGSTLSFDLIRINSANGNAVLVGPLGISGPFGLAIDSSGTMYLGQGSNNGSVARIWTVDKNNGFPTLVGDIAGASSFGMYGLALQAPEPASLTLLAIGGGVAMILFRRRRARNLRELPAM